MESSSRMSESEQNIAPFHHGTYHMLAEIGKGSFARVMKARHADSGQIFAIKMVKKKRLNNKLTANLQTEIQIMKNTRHPGIIRLYESYDTEGHVNLVMEYCKLGDMSRIIKHAGKLSTIPGLQEMDRRHHSYPKALNPMIVRLFARQLIDAIRFLHRRNLIHRDIKPQNILLDIEDVSNMSSERQVVLESLAKAIGVNVNAWRWLPLVKLADFGFARHLPSTSLAETLCGSPLYMGPEILRYERYDAKADLWSLGAVVFEMLTGKPPFRAKNHIELLRRIDTTVLEFPKPAINYPDGSDYPKDLQRFILGLLKKTPVERMSFETAFNHDAMVCTLEDLALEDSPSGAPTLTRRPGSARLSDGGNSLSRPGSSKSIRSVFQSSTHIHSPKRSNTTDGVNLNAPEASRRPPKRTATINDDGFTHTPVTSARSPSSSAFDPTVVQQTSSRSSIRGAANGLGIQGHSQNMGAASPRTRGTTSTEMARAIEDALSPGVVPMSKSPSHSSVKGQKPKLASHKVGSEMAFERDYVVVEKKQVEVNAMADEMAASPQGHDKNQLIRSGQERGLRSGTLAPPLVAGFGEACRIAKEELPYDTKRIKYLSDRLLNGLLALEHATQNGSPDHFYPGCVNVSFAYVEGESLLMALKDIALSSGSACTSASLEPSYVLRALGNSDESAHSSIRFGIGRFTTEAEIDYVLKAVQERVTFLRELSPLWELVQEGIDLNTIEWSQH